MKRLSSSIAIDASSFAVNRKNDLIDAAGLVALSADPDRQRQNAAAVDANIVGDTVERDALDAADAAARSCARSCSD